MMKCKGLIFSMLMLACLKARAQQIYIDETYTAQQLAETIMDTDCEVQIINAVITGYNGPEGTSYGRYNFAPGIWEDAPLQNGIILSSGHDMANSGLLWLFDFTSTGDASWPGDTDINNAIGGGALSYNATFLEFDFVPSVNYVSFTFLMVSSEFESLYSDTNRDCTYNDGIAVLIKPADNSQPYQNLALIPLTATPISNGNLYYYEPCFENYSNWAMMYNNNQGVVTAGANVTPGVTYHLKIGVVDGLDTAYDSSILIAAVNPDYSINLGLDRLLQHLDPLCDGEVLIITSKPGAVTYKWYKDDVLIAGETGQNYTVSQPGTYTSVATMPNGCDYTGNIVIEYSPPIAQTPLTYYQCDEDGDGFTGYYIPQVGQQVIPNGLQPLVYYHTLADANNGMNPITITPTPTLYYNVVPDEYIYVKVQNQYGCPQILPIILSVAPQVAPQLAPVSGCPEAGQASGFATFNLAQAAVDVVQGFPPDTTAQFFTTEAEALIGITPLPDLYVNTVSGGGTLYVRLASSQGCYGIGMVALIIQDFDPGLVDEAVALCPDETLFLDAGSGYLSYTWSTDPVQHTQNISIAEPGAYTVAVTNAIGCVRNKTFTVFESGPPQSIAFEISDFKGGHNSILVITEGMGQYEYSLDGVNYQPENTFEHLQPGQYTVYTRDLNGCGPLLKDNTVILDYPTFFTPNGDGIIDTWRIPFMQLRPGAVVTVFDRYGKRITAFSGLSAGWDGTLENRPLPATDYWFTVNLENGRMVKGHFSLIR